MRTLVIGTCLTCLLAWPAAAGAEDPPKVAKPSPAPPAPVVPAASAAELSQQLKEALGGSDEEAQVEALAAAHGVGDKALAREVARALRSKESAVRQAAVLALGRMPVPEALDALHDTLERDRRLKDDEALFALTLREIGRHGEARSVKVLLDDPFRWLTVASGTARLMAVANIRSPESVEGLISTGKKVGSGGGRGGTQSEIVAGLRPAFRVAMVVLTGHDEGPGAGLAWERWWKETGKKAGIAKERPPVPAEVRAFWEAFWKQPYGTEGVTAPAGGTRPVTIVATPTPAQVEEAVTAIKAAFDAKDEEALAETLQRFGGVQSKAVVHEIARGLTSRTPRVRWVTIDVLGWSRYEPALKQLHRLLARERDLPLEDEALFAHLLKSIGRHSDKSSIEVLADHPLRGLTYASGRARILGLARIRSKDSVEELMKAMVLAGDRPRRRGGDSVVPRFLQDFRLALMILTGEDKGPSKQAWLDWWRDAKKTFKPSDSRPTIPAAARAIWEEYWDEPYAG